MSEKWKWCSVPHWCAPGLHTAKGTSTTNGSVHCLWPFFWDEVGKAPMTIPAFCLLPAIPAWSHIWLCLCFVGRLPGLSHQDNAIAYSQHDLNWVYPSENEIEWGEWWWRCPVLWRHVGVCLRQEMQAEENLKGQTGRHWIASFVMWHHVERPGLRSVAKAFFRPARVKLSIQALSFVKLYELLLKKSWHLRSYETNIPFALRFMVEWSSAWRKAAFHPGKFQRQTWHPRSCSKDRDLAGGGWVLAENVFHRAGVETCSGSVWVIGAKGS